MFCNKYNLIIKNNEYFMQEMHKIFSRVTFSALFENGTGAFVLGVKFLIG